MNLVRVEHVFHVYFAPSPGLNRGVFGVPAEMQPSILDLISKLEAMNPIPQPTDDMEKVPRRAYGCGCQ